MTDQFTPTINHFSALIRVEDLKNDSNQIQEALDNFVALLDLHVVEKIIHKFDPIGLTLVYVLSESHLAVHSWPEYKLFHIDLVTCSELEKEMMENAAIKSFSKFGIKKLSIVQPEI